MKLFQIEPNHHKQLENEGYVVIENIYTSGEIQELTDNIEKTDNSGSTFRKSANLFAIRQLIKEIPALLPVLMNEKLNYTIRNLFGEDYFFVKSIYFDKPPASNWFVAWHQDLTISVDKRISLDNFGPWTVKQNQFAVQPPPDLLKSIYTIRIHLDDTNEHNGALQIIPGSHNKGIRRIETVDWSSEKTISCNVRQGGIMIMKPLLFHSSTRTTNNQNRRVIHLELANRELPGDLQWSERKDL